MDFNADSSDSKAGGGAWLEDARREKGQGKWTAKFTREELRDLFTLRKDTLCDTHDLVRRSSSKEGRGSTLAGGSNKVSAWLSSSKTFLHE